MQLTPSQSGFQHVPRIHSTFGFACAHHGVQFINEHNGLTFVFGQFIEHRLEALFKFTSKLGAGKQGSHVK